MNSRAVRSEPVTVGDGMVSIEPKHYKLADGVASLYAWRRRRFDLLEEFRQVGKIAIFIHGPKWAPPGNLEAWCRHVAKRAIRRYYRDHKNWPVMHRSFPGSSARISAEDRSPQRVELLDNHATVNPEFAYTRTLDAQLVRFYLTRLTGRERIVLESLWCGKTLAEIAASLNLSVAAEGFIHRIKTRGILQVREMLSRS